MISIGDRFGRLTVISKGESKNTQTRWVCKCDCGNSTLSYGPALRKGQSTSCGCYRKERIVAAKTKHGAARSSHRTPTYRSWESMIRRVSSPEYKGFHRYGGRGISVCNRWRDYGLFLKDMGERPNGTSLDRINPDGNYEPNNCRWADAMTQRHNRGGQ